MSSKARLSYTLENFPFERLRIGTIANNKVKRSDYGTIHQQTFIEENGELKNYGFEIPELHSTSISYWLDKDGKNMNNPDFYLNPELHHEYSKLDENGNPKKSVNGLAFEAFEVKFKAALRREIEKLSEDERGQIMGERYMELTKDTQLIFDIATFPKNDKDLPDKTKSKTIPMALWTQDETKRNLNNNQNNKRKYANLKPSVAPTTQLAGKKLKLPEGSLVTKLSNEQKQADDGLVRVPDTNAVIYTEIYDMTSHTMNSGKYTKKQLAGDEPLPKLTKYEEIKPFVYSSGSHFNGSGVRSDMLVMTKVLGPSLLWKPADGGIPAKIRLTISELIVVECSSTRNKRGLNSNRLRSIQSRREEFDKTYGFGANDEDDGDDNNQPQFNDDPFNGIELNEVHEGGGERDETDEEERQRLTYEYENRQRQRFANLSRQSDKKRSIDDANNAGDEFGYVEEVDESATKKARFT